MQEKPVSKVMFVRADQLMLRDVVTNDGELGTVSCIEIEIEAGSDEVTVWFLDGHMKQHDFCCPANQELNIVRMMKEQA